MGNVQDSVSTAPQTPPERPPKPNALSPGAVYPALGDSDDDYEILRPSGPGVPSIGPIRPAPKPPTPVVHQNSTHTLGAFQNALDGVPFIVNPKFLTSSSSQVSCLFELSDNFIFRACILLTVYLSQNTLQYIILMLYN